MSSIPFFLIFFGLVITFAAFRGGEPEKAAAGAFSLGLLGTVAFAFVKLPGNFKVASMGLLTIDTMLLFALCLIAIRANRWWPIFVAGCQLVAVLAHAAKLLDPAMIPRGYALFVKLWSWPMVALLAYGTWNHLRRLKAGIIVPDWKPFSTQRQYQTQATLQVD